MTDPITARLHTPIGTLAISATPDAITAIRFLESAPEQPPETVPDNMPDVLRLCVEELRAYFAGTLHAFSVPVDLAGTPFQQRVWAAVRAIPFGATCTYGDIARGLDDPNAVRAVGAANGKNPVPIIVPCHRVIGSDGTLTGYGGGLWRKAWLLRHEGTPVQQDLL